MFPTTTHAGKKRKRYTPVEKDVSVKLSGKLHHYSKEVSKAAKKAKAFETQRLVKKLKGLRKPVDDPRTVANNIKDLEAQLAVLKSTNHERIAHIALSSKIRKDKKLSSNSTLMTALESMKPVANAIAEVLPAQVESRLLSSKTIAAEVQSAVSGLRAALDPTSVGNLNHLATEDLWSGIAGDEIDEGGGSSSMDDNASHGMSVEAFDEDEDMIDDGWESGSIDDTQHEARGGISIPPHNRLKQHSSPLSLDLSDRDGPADTSTFLPSLSVGYLKGDSDSELDRSEGEIVTPGRKNRRGQRARQAIWEKKYGRNAKHVKKQREEAKVSKNVRILGKRPDKGWDGRRSDNHASKHGPSQEVSVKQPHASKQSVAKPDKKTVPEKPTHPSWEAKKRLKEREGARILPFQGKKILFT